MSILIIGESCVDEFIYCRATRLAPDIPVPILEVVEVKSNPGMAGNVHANVNCLTQKVQLLTNPNWELVKKTRYVDSSTNHTFLRVDNPSPIAKLESVPNLRDYEAIIISDYNKGFLSVKIINEICSLHPTVFLDTKKELDSWAEHALFVKINDYEYERSKPFVEGQINDRVIRTVGKQGCIYKGIRYSADEVNVGDSSGAGDTFIAALTWSYLQSADIVQAIKFANECASSVVAERGVTTIKASQ